MLMKWFTRYLQIALSFHLCECIKLDLMLHAKNGSKVLLSCKPVGDRGKLSSENTQVQWQGESGTLTELSRLALARNGNIIVPEIRVNTSSRYKCTLRALPTHSNTHKKHRRRALPDPEGSMPMDKGSCQSGYYMANDRCFPCHPGSYTSGQDTKCFPCPKHYFMPREAADSCWRCPDGKFTLSTGTDSEDACLFLSPEGKPVDPWPAKWIGIFVMLGLIFICSTLLAAVRVTLYWKNKKIVRKRTLPDLEEIDKAVKLRQRSLKGAADDEEHIYEELSFPNNKDQKGDKDQGEKSVVGEEEEEEEQIYEIPKHGKVTYAEVNNLVHDYTVGNHLVHDDAAGNHHAYGKIPSLKNITALAENPDLRSDSLGFETQQTEPKKLQSETQVFTLLPDAELSVLARSTNSLPSWSEQKLFFSNHSSTISGFSSKIPSSVSVVSRRSTSKTSLGSDRLPNAKADVISAKEIDPEFVQDKLEYFYAQSEKENSSDGESTKRSSLIDRAELSSVVNLPVGSTSSDDDSERSSHIGEGELSSIVEIPVTTAMSRSGPMFAKVIHEGDENPLERDDESVETRGRSEIGILSSPSYNHPRWPVGVKQMEDGESPTGIEIKSNRFRCFTPGDISELRNLLSSSSGSMDFSDPILSTKSVPATAVQKSDFEDDGRKVISLPTVMRELPSDTTIVGDVEDRRMIQDIGDRFVMPDPPPIPSYRSSKYFL